MKLIHCTLRNNIPSIRRRGLLCSKSTGHRKAVWFVPPDCTGWAAMHVAGRHKANLEDLAILECDVKEDHLRRHGEGGTYYHVADVPASAIVCIKTISWQQE